MLTSYLVECPHMGCSWRGRQVGRPAKENAHSCTPAVSIVAFQCPACQQPWRARVIGDDVDALPLDVPHVGLEPFLWPPIDIGVGD
jgi:hypothetical protein